MIDCDVTFTGWSSFTNNSVGTAGGGIFSTHSRLNFNGINTFTHNTAHKFGGGFFVLHSIVTFTSTTIFTYNSAENGGGISSLNSILTFSGISNFTPNKAVIFGGGLFAVDNSREVYSSSTSFFNNSANYEGGFSCRSSNVNFTGVNTFINNSAMGSGGGINTDDSTFVFSGKNVFTRNTAIHSGGALYSSYDTARFDGESKFISNSAGHSGGVAVFSHSNSIFKGSNMFSNNSAVRLGGGLAIIGSSYVIFNKNITFVKNSAENGGGLAATSCSLVVAVFFNNSVENLGGGLLATNCSGVFRGNNSFLENAARNAGGGAAILDSNLELCGNTSFIDNLAAYFGGGIYARDSHAVFKGSSRFIHNFAGGGGGAAFPVGTFLNFIGNTTFNKNFASFYGGAIYSIFQPFGTARSAVKFNGTVEFVGNVAGNGGGALAQWNYIAVFIGRCTFSHNAARSGGALIGSTPMCYFFPNCSVYFESNYAAHRGGAINHLDDPFYKCFLLSRLFEATKLLIPCFFRIPQESDPQIELVFTNNTAAAEEAGDSLYGGAIDNCLTYSIEGTRLGYDMFDSLSTITDNSTTSSVSSDPFRACACINNVPDFSNLSFEHEIYPGATFFISGGKSAVGVGQRNGTVPAVIRAELGMKSKAKIDDLQKAQAIEQHCSILQYTVYSHATFEEINLYAEGPCPRLGDPLPQKPSDSL